VHGADGLDEISLSGETYVAELHEGAVKRYTLTPEDFGMSRAPIETLRGGDATENAALIREVLEGQPGPRHDIAIINAAAALVASGIAANFRDGAQLAAKAISSGLAQKKLAALVAFTN
jgi:anthranilate phosphoribosyltransferase